MTLAASACLVGCAAETGESGTSPSTESASSQAEGLTVSQCVTNDVMCIQRCDRIVLTQDPNGPRQRCLASCASTLQACEQSAGGGGGSSSGGGTNACAAQSVACHAGCTSASPQLRLVCDERCTAAYQACMGR
jgi:hypothetical protein